MLINLEYSRIDLAPDLNSKLNAVLNKMENYNWGEIFHVEHTDDYAIEIKNINLVHINKYLDEYGEHFDSYKSMFYAVQEYQHLHNFSVLKKLTEFLMDIISVHDFPIYEYLPRLFKASNEKMFELRKCIRYYESRDNIKDYSKSFVFNMLSLLDSLYMVMERLYLTLDSIICQISI